MTRVWLVLVSAIILGLASFGIQYSASRPLVLDESISEFATVPASFVVLDEPRRFGAFNSYRSNVRLIAVQIMGTDQFVAARGELRGIQKTKFLASGGTYSCNLSLSPSSAGERAGFYGQCADELKQVVGPPKVNQVVSKVRNAFMAQLQGVTSDAKGLVAGLAIGDTTQLSESLISNMKTVSLTHLTAVSGANCAIVLAMVYLLVARLGGGKWPRLIAGLITLIAYVSLVGAQPSVLRAAVMAGFVLVAISMGRKSSALSALALAILVLLVADPWLSVDYGFALSVAATSGLLILAEPIAKALSAHLPRWLALSIAVALSAQVFCLPVLLQLQNGLSTYSLPANLMAEPLVAPITVLGIMAVVTAIPFPWLAGCLSYMASLGCVLIASVANYFSALPNESLNWPTGIVGALAALAVIAGFVLRFKTEPTRTRNLGISLLAIILAISVGSLSYVQIRSAAWPMQNWKVVACDVGQGDGMVLKSGGKVAVIDVGRDDKPIDDCLGKLGVQNIDLLVLTHFDMDHVGGIRGALNGRSVSTALLSPFEDERWGATGTQQFLKSIGSRLVLAERGMTGALGDFSWQVVSPERGAAGAEDSNDASIVMLWSSKDFSLITMADIGERGQMRMISKSPWWKSQRLQMLPLILKVSHHGSADQFPELIDALAPDLSLVSVGQSNSYGHPTLRILTQLKRIGSKIARTDELGSIAVSAKDGGLLLASTR